MTDIEEYQMDAARIRAQHERDRISREEQAELDRLRPLVIRLVDEALERRRR